MIGRIQKRWIAVRGFGWSSCGANPKHNGRELDGRTWDEMPGRSL